MSKKSLTAVQLRVWWHQAGLGVVGLDSFALLLLSVDGVGVESAFAAVSDFALFSLSALAELL